MTSRITPKELYACIYIREFHAQSMLRLRPELRDKPCVIMEGNPPLEQVCSMNAKARALGVIRGMTRVEIETFPSVQVLTNSQVEETTAANALLECAGTFSPRVEDHSSDNTFICVADIAGTDKLYGPPTVLARTLHGRIKSFGFVASIAVSSNFYAAISMARGMNKRHIAVIPPGDECAALAALPLAVLNLSEEHADTLCLWGIHTLGMLAALPEKALISRMGQAGKRLRQMSRGELSHLFQPVEPAFALEEHIELDAPVELLDALLFILGLMLEQLILRATARILALASATITLTLEGGATHTRTVRPALPNNERMTWLKLIHLDLEAHPPDRPILALKLTAEPGSPSKVQLGLFSPQLPETMRLDVTLARIRAIVGEDNVGRAVLQDTHKPDSFQIDHFHLASQSTPHIVGSNTRSALRQLRPLENITIALRGRHPAAFYFRQKHYIVEHAYGPWIASGNWWHPTLWSNEQWDLIARSEDHSLLCCCLIRNVAEECWQMAALYD